MAAISDASNTMRMARCCSSQAHPYTSPSVSHEPMRSGMTSQKIHKRGVHGRSYIRTRNPRRGSIKSCSRGRINLVQPMRPAAECPPAQPIATKKSHLAAEDEFNTEGGTTEMEGFFDNIAAADTNGKAFLSQLTDNNTKLININEELLASVKKLTNENRQLQQEIITLQQRVGGNTGGNTTNNARGSGSSCRCPNCKREVYHAPDEFYKLEKNASRRQAGWRSSL